MGSCASEWHVRGDPESPVPGGAQMCRLALGISFPWLFVLLEGPVFVLSRELETEWKIGRFGIG